MRSRRTDHGRSTWGAGLELGRLVVALLTGWAWVARTCLGFIVPTAGAGGDALPLHDTAADRVIDWKFSPSGPPLRTQHSVADETVLLGDLEPTDRPFHQQRQVSGPLIVDADRFLVRHRVPWSVVLAVVGSGSVWLVGQVIGSAAGPVASIAFWASVVCGVLLTVAQLVDGGRR